MPIAPRPMSFVCPACGWKRTTLPISDALVLGRDWFGQCPACAHQPLDVRPATRTEIMRERLLEFLPVSRA